MVRSYSLVRLTSQTSLSILITLLGLVAVCSSALPSWNEEGRQQVPFRATPTVQNGVEVDGSSPERQAEMAALLNKYAPVFKLASTERYYPSSIEYMLDKYSFIEWEDGRIYRPDRKMFSKDKLGELEFSGVNQSLSVDEDHNGQPLMPNKAAEFLYGPSGQDGALEIGPDGRGRVHDEVYGFWVDQGRGVVDMWYWTFYPYNLGKLVGTLGYLGNHVVDLEHLRIRTVNGVAVSADFDTHSGGPFSAGTYRWDEIERTDDDRPIAYVASGSHGVWPTPGKHVYAQLLNLWALVDVADDQGAIWDTKDHVVPIEFWTGPDEARKIKHTGDLEWLEFVGSLGNRGSSDCWWHFFVGICQVLDAPPGPNRDFGYPPDCIIAEAAEKSTYSFYLTRAVVEQAKSLNVTLVVIEQVCARPSKATQDWTGDIKMSDLEIWPMQVELEFTGEVGHEYITPVPACAGSRSAAKAYRLALFDGLGERVSTSDLRTLCIYEQGRKGFVAAPAAHVRDVDEWRWNLQLKNPDPKPPKHSDPVNDPL